ncbi:MAG: HD domain-containing phosphohydrolase, partial [Actinomycetota bacterium]
ISTVLNAGICLLMFYDPEKDALVAQEPAVGLTKNKIDALVIPMKAGGSLVSVFQEDKPFISNSVLKDPSTKKFFHGYDIKNLVIMPLKGRAKMMGVMCVANKKGGFTQRDLELLTTSARQTAIYAERTQFYEATKRNAKQSMLLHRLSKDLSSTLDLKVLQKLIVENVVHLLDAHKCSLMLVDEESGQLTVCATHGLDDEITRNTYTEAQERVARWVAETGRTLLLANSNDPRFQDVKYKGGVCSVLSVPLKVKDKVIGVLNAGSLCPHQFTKEDLRILSTLASEVAIAIHNAQLFAEIEELYLDTMKAMVRAIEAKDPYTRGHSERVTDYALAIAEELDLSEKEKELLYTAGLLHDIGKIGIGEEILLKPGKLTKEEYDVVKRHPLIGTQILGTIKALREAIPLILHHHEHYDGSGYVSGLKGEDIPLSSRILAVADAFEAMTSHRPYRKALGFQEAIEELKKNAGTQFDPIIVEAFMRVVGVSDISRD